ncbi:hypothetical protein Desgi_3528 [Desulfoscipio gibsoniae DSM 7213]|uniref:Uncharacterized protein n=1 Tax=Desulfoscipio gibsoniae DSM 7213 TaxID=767817 RepID=R4KI18_9FIRM|nr:hypothetical protein Desgi_3528 [Desulfoscipio gibsoniae DSM 7213]
MTDAFRFFCVKYNEIKRLLGATRGTFIFLFVKWT